MKKKIIIGAIFIFLLAAAGLRVSFFGHKKSINISLQNSISETEQQSVQDEQNNQPAEKNTAEKTNLVPLPPIVGDIPKNNSSDASDTAKDSGPVKSGDHGVNKIVDRFVTWGFQKASGRKIDTLIIHSSYDALGSDPYSIDGIIAEFKQYGVSAHYLIARDGTTYHLVADQNIAWHAGVSKMPDGRTGVNNFSIGIEMVNTQDGQFTAAQYSSLNGLIASLKKQYLIKYILGHSDIAPGRKTDPWNIDWDKVKK
jgi:hypothetical protein